MGVSLTFRSVTKSFPRIGPVLVDFDLAVAPNEFVSLVGPSGCGKSTALRLALGLDHEFDGHVEFGAKGTPGDASVGIAFQEPRLLPWLPVRENLELVLGREATTERVDSLLELVELSSFARAYPKELSGGMAQRVSLARALAKEPDVLLLDEPFSALDALTRLRLQDAVVRIHRGSPRTTVLVTHDIDEALFTSTRVVVMTGRPGRIADVVDIPFPYPRERTDSRLLELKARVLKRLGSDLTSPVAARHAQRPPEPAGSLN